MQYSLLQMTLVECGLTDERSVYFIRAGRQVSGLARREKYRPARIGAVIGPVLHLWRCGRVAVALGGTPALVPVVESQPRCRPVSVCLGPSAAGTGLC